MLTFPQLRDCEPDVFARDAQTWQALATALTKRGSELDDQVRALAGWTGAAGDAARAGLTAKRGTLTGAASTVAKIPPVLTGLSGTLAGLRSTLNTAMGTASTHHLTIAGDGTVSPSGIINALEDLLPGHKAMVHALAAQLTTQVPGLLKQATAADSGAAGQLAGLTAQAAGLAPAGGDVTLTAAATALPKAGTAPADVAKWWSGLSPQQQESLLFLHGDQLGSLDGIPAMVRDRANRAVLTEQQDQLTEQAARLTAPGEDNDQLAAIKGKLAAVSKRLAEPAGPAHPQPYLLDISGAGNGRAIVAMGDPDTATDVATYVPGTGADLAHASGDMNRSDLMAYAATKAGSPSTSVITWIGYDAPPTIPHAISPSYAEHAETSLRGFQDGLRATHQGAPSRNTVIGHSYGTTVIGYAAKGGGTLNADGVVFVASPGVGVHSAQDIHLTGVPAAEMHQHVYATTAQHDMIRAADGVFGPDPSDSGFGATDFSAAPGKAGPWYEGGLSGAVHSQYWDPGNPSLTNLGDIIAGKPTS